MPKKVSPSSLLQSRQHGTKHSHNDVVVDGNNNTLKNAIAAGSKPNGTNFPNDWQLNKDVATTSSRDQSTQRSNSSEHNRNSDHRNTVRDQRECPDSCSSWQDRYGRTRRDGEEGQVHNESVQGWVLPKDSFEVLSAGRRLTPQMNYHHNHIQNNNHNNNNSLLQVSRTSLERKNKHSNRSNKANVNLPGGGRPSTPFNQQPNPMYFSAKNNPKPPVGCSGGSSSGSSSSNPKTAIQNDTSSTNKLHPPNQFHHFMDFMETIDETASQTSTNSVFVSEHNNNNHNRNHRTSSSGKKGCCTSELSSGIHDEIQCTSCTIL